MIYGVHTSGSGTHTNNVKYIRSFKRCNTEELLHELDGAPWSVMDTFDSIDDKWSYWKSLFFSVIDHHAPVRKVRVRKNTNPWITEDILQITRARNYYRTKYRKTGNVSYWESYKKLRNLSKSALRTSKATYFNSVCASMSQKPRKAWNELNKAMGRNHHRGISMLKIDGREVSDNGAISEEFSKFFATSGHFGHKVNINSMSVPRASSRFRMEEIHENLTLDLLLGLNIRKATGGDGVSARLLKTTAPAVAKSLTHLFNCSLRTGKIPQEWKAANVTPVPKKGRKEDVNSYRPVSVLPVIAKVFEAVVHRQLYQYLEENQLLDSAQSGFRPMHSSLDALLKTTDDWRRALDRNKIVGAVFIDLSKAFDSIDHELLLCKLDKYGVQGNELQWFRNYLADRRQRVTVNGAMSSWRPVSRGVPQGSILGPLLFCLFVNDMPGSVGSCTVGLYADDTMLYHCSKDLSDLEDSLQDNLDGIARWIDDNGLKMNMKKTQVMFLSRRGRKEEVKHARVMHHGVALEAEASVRYLGVTLDKDLKWDEHVLRVRKRCLASLAQLRRIFPSLPIKTRILLYNALVLPHLDYCSSVWNCCSAGMRSKLEKVQNYAMRLITSSPPRTSSADLRSKLKWTTLQNRRAMQLLMKVHKCVNGRAPPYMTSKFVASFNSKFRETRSELNIQLQQPQSTFYWNSFEFAGAYAWNSLPSSIKKIKSSSHFKSALTNHFIQLS